MSYPEKGASYDHKPKFIERMKRAEGGVAQGENLQSVNAPLRPLPLPTRPADAEQQQGRVMRQRADGGAADEPMTPLPNTVEKLEHGGTYLQKMRTDPGGRGLSDWRGSFADQSAVPMPTVQSADTGDNMNADTSANTPSFLRGRTPKRHGGRVRKGD